MLFSELVGSGRKMLVEGSMYDRLSRLAGDSFDSELAHLGLLYSDRGREVLAATYNPYLQAARKASLPIIVFTPTWRANQERVSRSSLKHPNVNGDAALFVSQLCENSALRGAFVGGLIGCKNDCYRPDQSLSIEQAEQFHRPQILELADSEVDFLFASTLPAVSEASGIARVMAQTDKPYVLSFVSDREGKTLDGVPLAAAFNIVMAQVERKPLGFFVNCTHPGELLRGLVASGINSHQMAGIWIGFQGNTSRRDPRDFDTLDALETEQPEEFASVTLELADLFGINLLGGCCGTGPEHIAAIGERIARRS